MIYVKELMKLITAERLPNGRIYVSIDGTKVIWPCREDQYLTLRKQASNLVESLIAQGKKPEEIKEHFKNEVYNYAWNMFPPVKD